MPKQDNSSSTEAAEGKSGANKNKLVRDSFTIPKAEYAVLNELKQRATKLAQPAKKTEILRAGVMLLQGLTDAAFLAALAAVPNLKTGRPGKSDGDTEDHTEYDTEDNAPTAPAARQSKKVIDKTVTKGANRAAGKAARVAKAANTDNPDKARRQAARKAAAS
jgi:hypothetical protein